MRIREFLDRNFPSSTEKYRPNMNGVLVEIDPDYSPPNAESAFPFATPFELDIRPMLGELSECEEFLHAESLEKIDTPFVVDDNGRFIEVVTLKVTDDLRFHGRVLLFQVSDSNTILYQGDNLKPFEPVLKGAFLTPILYDTETFEPKRRIGMEFSPEISAMGDDRAKVRLKEHLHGLLDEIIDFPEAFTKKPDRVFTVRGIFERVESDSGITVEESKTTKEWVTDLSALKDPVEHTRNYRPFFFFEHNMENDVVRMGLGKYIVPQEMEEGITRELGNRPGREQIEEFLIRSGRQDVVDKNNALGNEQ